MTKASKLRLSALTPAARLPSSGVRWAMLAASLVSLGAAAAEGEIRKIDVAQSRVTIKSGPITSLDLPAMTLVFKAKPASLLNGLTEGDVVSFEAQKIDGQYSLVSIKKR